MKIIICGPALPEKAELVIPGASPAAAKYLRNMENAFNKKGYEVKMFSYITAPLSERAKEILAMEKDNNVYISKGDNVIVSLQKFRKKIKAEITEDDIVLFYNICYSSWGLLDYVKRIGAKAMLILADHTESDECQGCIRKIMTKVDERNLKKFDNAIVLSENADRILKRKCKTLLLEGGLDLSVFSSYHEPNWKSKKIILYSGMLSKVTGVNLLIDAFNSKRFDNCELWITGKGELEESVIQASMNNKNIIFKGFVSNEEFYRILNQVDIVVNPRNMNFTQNANNFPSKILEYLASGRIILSTQFPGYYRFEKNITFCDSNAKDIAQKLAELLDLEKDVITERFYSNRKFSENFSWLEQVERIIEFIGG